MIIAGFTVTISLAIILLLNSQISTEFTRCIKPSRVTGGIVVIGKVVNIKESGEKTFFDLRLCDNNSQLLNPKITIIASSGFIGVAKREDNGFYYSNERTKNFINSSGQLIAVRVNPDASGLPTQNHLINQLRKPLPLMFFLPYIFSPPELTGSMFLTANYLSEIENVITANGL